MTNTPKKPARGLRGFLFLGAIVFLGGALLWSQGDLISPVQSTSMLVNLSSSDAGFAMVGDGQRPTAATTTTDSAAVADTSTVTAASKTTTSASSDSSVTAASMTLEEFMLALTTAGVDVEAVTATMAAEGRSLDNLLTVVNSGRTTIEELASRLQNTSASTTATSTSEQMPAGEMRQGGESSSLLDFRWDELGSVAYNLWFILATTIVVILLGKPAGWLVNRINRTTKPSIW